MKALYNFTILSILGILVIFISETARADQQAVHVPNETVTFLREVKYILVDTRVKQDREVSYRYPPNKYKNEVPEDYNNRSDFKIFRELLYPSGKYQDHDAFAHVFVELLQNRLDASSLSSRRFVVLVEDSIKHHESINLASDNTIYLMLKVGQQSYTPPVGAELLIGAVDEVIEKPDLKFGNSEQLGDIIVPEPFIFDPHLGDRADFIKSLDFLALQLEKYLEYVFYIGK